jgi:hypothetical protein
MGGNMNILLILVLICAYLLLGLECPKTPQPR